VTVIVGIICKDSIVLASDSRTTTEGEYLYFRDDAAKISMIELAADGGRRPRALIAQSGHADLSSRTVEIMERTARDRSLNDYRAVADLAEAAVRELREKAFGNRCLTSEEAEQFRFQLMIAHSFNGKPHLFTLTFDHGVALWTRGVNLATLGCGGPLAQFLLKPFDLASMETPVATAAAVYAIEAVKSFDPRCGGRTQTGAAFIAPDNSNQASLADWENLRFFVDEVESLVGAAKDDWTTIMKTVLQRASRKWATRSKPTHL
jgi:20S proteasome alpha/beta subunit